MVGIEPWPKNDKRKLKPKQQLVIALDDLDLSWYPGEAETVRRLCGYGWHISDIAKYVRRDIDEVAVLIMHLARQKKIQGRKKGVKR